MTPPKGLEPKVGVPTTFLRKGNQTPTTHIHNPEGKSLYDENPVIAKDIDEFVSKPFPWQKLVYRDIFAIKEDGSFQYKTVCLSVPRRNGKTEIILGVMIIFALLFNAKTLYTAQIQNTADDVYSRFMDLIESKKSRLHMYFPGIDRKTKVAEEVVRAYHPRTGKPLGTLEFRGRKGDKGRGITRDVVIIDEAQDYDFDQESRFGSINGSSEIGLTFLVGTPPALHKENAGSGAGVIFRGIREEALAERDLIWEARQKKGTAWIEWGADSVKQKSDRDAWYRNNPSMGYLPRAALSEDWFENRTSDPEGFSVENLGYWGKQVKDRVIPIELFNRAAISEKDLKEKIGKSGKFAVGIKSDLEERFIHIGTAFRGDDGKISYLHVQTFYADEDMDKHLEAITIRLLKNSNCVVAYVDGSLAQAKLIPMLTRAGLWRATKATRRQGKVSLVGPTDIARACSTLVASVSSRNLIHSAQPPLHDAAEDAGKRKIGDSGYGFRGISGIVDVSPLEACALAVYGVETKAQIRSRDMGMDSAKLQSALGAL